MKSGFPAGDFSPRSLLVAAALLSPRRRAGCERRRGPRVNFDNDVNPVTQDYVTAQIDRANKRHYDAVVIVLDTPGGLSTRCARSTRRSSRRRSR